MVVFPNIKINLGLYITGKRADGYHNLLSCFYPVNWCDILEIVPKKEFEFIQTGIQVPGDKNSNLCIKAYQMLKEDFNLPPVSIHLHKVIPMGAGLGGGSSDAAFTFKVLNQMFKLGLSEAQLAVYALKAGSDCPFFISNKPAIASSRGEILEETDTFLKGKYILIVYPEIHVSTAQAFQGVKPQGPPYNFQGVLQKEDSWQKELHNQFEDTVFPLFPELHRIKETLYEKGAIYASMSGSGSAVYGVFNAEPPLNFPEYSIFKGIL